MNVTGDPRYCDPDTGASDFRARCCAFFHHTVQADANIKPGFAMEDEAGRGMERSAAVPNATIWEGSSTRGNSQNGISVLSLRYYSADGYCRLLLRVPVVNRRTAEESVT